MFLIDTDVLSALRRGERHRAAARWLEAQRTSNLYLSVVTIGEVERGIEQQQRRNPAFADELAGWLDRVLAWYGDRVLPVDLATAQRWGRLSRPGRRDTQREALRACRRVCVQPLRTGDPDA